MRRVLLVLTIGAALATASASAQTARLHPDMKVVPVGDVAQWFGSDNYPADAVRAKRQGRVVAAIDVDSAGEVVTCSTEVSSGTTRLDLATCAIAKDHLHFNPATDHEGRPTASVYRLPVKWVLPETVQATAVDLTKTVPDSVVEIELAFDAEGTLLSCRPLTVASAAQVTNPCRGSQPGTKTLRRWLRDGQPVGAVVVQRFSEHVTPTP